jgi:hypothetical protein
LDSVDETPSNDEDETKMFKRTPGRRRRRRFRIRIRGRRIKERVRKLHKGLKKVCKVVEPVLPTGRKCCIAAPFLELMLKSVVRLECQPEELRCLAAVPLQ